MVFDLSNKFQRYVCIREGTWYCKTKKKDKKQQLVMPPKFVFVFNVMWYFNYNA